MIILSSPSGAGKTTLVKKLSEKANISFILTKPKIQLLFYEITLLEVGIKDTLSYFHKVYIS